MKRSIILLTICFFLSSTVILSLILLSDNLTRRPNSFLRVFPPHPVLQKKSLDIKYNSYYISGVSAEHIYLGNFTAPLHLIKINKELTDTVHIKIELKNIDLTKEKFWGVRVKIDSPYFHVTDGTRPNIFTGKIDEWKAQRNPHDSAYFVDILPLSRASFAIRSLSAITNQYELGKEIVDQPQVDLKEGILEKQVDGQFCVDGMMNFDKETGKLVYVYYYRNQYIVMDTNLNVEGKGRTIDTISRAKIKVATIASNNSKTMAAPPLMVNKRSCLYGKWLFVNSDQMARNELREEFDELSVIDVYDLKTKEYKFSFYLSHYTKSKLKDFRVFDDKLIALFDKFIVIYDVVPRYFH